MASQGLIIVESPAKARTLKRFLGDRYDVLASMGHVRDLPERELAVDVDHDFEPSYVVVEDREKTIRDLRSAVGKSGGRQGVILASDPDREGEAIAWHLSEVLKLKDPQRIEFHEITADAVRRALESPRGIDMRLVNAQQARRIVDRLVGYRLSPFLWSKVQKGIGAGRVQSVALRLVVDREADIRAFVAEESWTVDALLSKQGGGRGEGLSPARPGGEAPQAGEERTFKARLLRRAGDPANAKLELTKEEDAEAILAELQGSDYKVLGVERKQRSKSAPPPYITSTLQQDASSRLRFAPRRTMRLAQDLYEGIELGGEGSTGLITYMRTDSTRVSAEAEGKVSGWIRSRFGDRYLGRPRAEKARPGAQDAHEAIRPTDPARRPEDIRRFLSHEQFRLYELIWRRFVASRMAPAQYANTQAEIEGGRFIFRATGSVLTFDGFYKVWERGDDEEEEGRLPELNEGEALRFHGLEPEQHFTQPPPRYSEATLIKELEERGIGRPSTYASIVATIQDHGYVEQKERRLHPSPLGEGVNKIMVDHFKEISADDYTAALEARLDSVEQGQVEWVPVVGDFYRPLERMLSAAEEAIPADTGEVCPECGEGHLVLKASRFGPFKGCSRYPKCKFRQAQLPTGAPAEAKTLDEKCPECGKPLQVKHGRYGEFIGCSGYPECKYIRRENQPEAKPTGQQCPECKQGELMEREGRYGPFLSCSRYPDCRYRANKRKDGSVAPARAVKVLDEPCPICGKPMVERQGRYGAFKSCSDYPRCPGPKAAGKGTAKGGAKGGAKAAGPARGRRAAARG
jgi:DNA topoisomerase-1